MGMVHLFADYIEGLRYEDLPPDVVEQAKYCILDGMGNLLGGEKESREMGYASYLLKKQSGLAESTLLGYGKTSCELAAFLNAVMLRNLDLDDGHRTAMGHPGSTLVPTALAVAEKTGATGRDLITALVVGYETHVRVGLPVYPYAYSAKGFEATNTNGTIADTAVVAKLIGMDAPRIAHALGIATTFTGALIEYQADSTSGKVLCAAVAASDALRAVELAEAGFTGPDKIFEGSRGFFQAYGPGPTEENPFVGLGDSYAIMSIYFKTHACMRGLHAAIDAVLELREKYNAALNQVEQVKVYASPFVKRLVKAHPQQLHDCQSNLFYCMGVALRYGYIDTDTLSWGIGQSDIRAFEERTEFVLDPGITEYVKANPSHWNSCRVELTTKDGAVFTANRQIAMGEPEMPFPRSVLEEKFVKLLARSRWSGKSKEIMALILDFDRLDSVDKLWGTIGV